MTRRSGDNTPGTLPATGSARLFGSRAARAGHFAVDRRGRRGVGREVHGLAVVTEERGQHRLVDEPLGGPRRERAQILDEERAVLTGRGLERPDRALRPLLL